MSVRLLWAGVALCACFGAEAGTLRLDQYYTSGAVLQQGVALPVSGLAAPGASVKVSFAGATASATADEKGRWVASLPARKAGGPHALEVTAGTETQTATNVLVGEVWLVSGQSNAYFPINRFAPKEEWLRDSDCPKIRFMEITWQPPHMRRPDRWNVVTPQTAGKCSATGFFFAKDLQRKMNGVPVGVVVAASDGSVIQKWLSEDALRKVPGMPGQMAKQAAGLFETYIAPMVPFPFAGVIWYQGESNGMFAQGYDYRFYLREMIRDWRARWNAPLPFLVVQLPHYNHSQIWGDVRDSQNLVASQEPDVFVVPTFDIGDMKNIHPPRKPELGARLSAFARHFVYGEDSLTPEGPVYEGVEPKGGELLVRFRSRAPLASRDGQPLRGFHVAGADGKFWGATVRIADETTLAVSARQVAAPVAVRYGWEAPDEVNFFDAEGRVAGAFRSDTFRLPTQAHVPAGAPSASVPGGQRHAVDARVAAENVRKVTADLAKAGKGQAEVAVYVVPPMSAVKRLPSAYPSDGRLFAPLSWIASRGEFEPASFVMYATGGDFPEVTVDCGDLVSKAGGRIPASAVDFKVVKCWYQGGSAWYGYFADACSRTLVPELLLHDENLVIVDDAKRDNYVRYENEDGARRYQWMSSRFEVTDYTFANQANQGLIRDADTLRPFVLNRGEFKQLMATVRVPKDAKGGVYRGSLALKAKGRVLARLDLRCRVLPLDLPDPKTQYDPDKDFYLCLYGTGTRNPKVMRDLAEHNCLTPQHFPQLDPMNPAGVDRDLRLAKEYGFKTRPSFFGVDSCGLVNWSGGKPSPEHLAKLAVLSNTIAKTRALALDKLGHTDFYSYAVDEGGPQTIRGERDAWRIVHEAGGKIGVTSYAWRELLFALDLLIIPSMPVERRQAEVKLFHDSNPDALCGWYANPHCGPENPDYFRRIHGLTAWQAGYDVSLNYCWWRNNWNDMAVPYEPNLRAIVTAYGTADSVLDTLAWDAIREGVDDIRYATLLKQLALKAAKSDNPAALLRGRRALSWLAYWDGYRMDPDAFRAEAVNYILELNDLLGK